MTGVNVTFDVRGMEASLRALGGLALAGRDLTPAMDEIGRTVVDHTQLRFERGRAPDGTPWRPSLRAAAEGGVTLIDSGQLRSSITHTAGRTQVEIGTTKIYGAIHQFGGQTGRGHKTTIRARPYLGLDDSDREDIPDIVIRHLQAGLA